MPCPLTAETNPWLVSHSLAGVPSWIGAHKGEDPIEVANPIDGSLQALTVNLDSVASVMSDLMGSRQTPESLR